MNQNNKFNPIKPRALILTGYGINCEEETAHCFARAGAEAEIVHVSSLIANKNLLKDAHVFVVPGGFSYGDHISSGKILANKLRYTLQQELLRFIAEGKLVLGICNGFQVLVKSGFLGSYVNAAVGVNENKKANEDKKSFSRVSVIANTSARYEDRWVHLRVNAKATCLWLRGVRSIKLPVRHGEGRVVFAGKEEEAYFKNNNLLPLQYVDENGALATSYPTNPNGSQLAAAGIATKQGNVLGLMPHPEAFSQRMQSPGFFSGKKYFSLFNSVSGMSFDSDLQLEEGEEELRGLMQKDDGAGMVFFYNAMRYVRKNFL